MFTIRTIIWSFMTILRLFSFSFSCNSFSTQAAQKILHNRRCRTTSAEEKKFKGSKGCIITLNSKFFVQRRKMKCSLHISCFHLFDLQGFVRERQSNWKDNSKRTSSGSEIGRWSVFIRKRKLSEKSFSQFSSREHETRRENEKRKLNTLKTEIKVRYQATCW